MRRIGLIAGILLMGASAASADSCIIVYDLNNPTYLANDTAITLAFDAMEAAVGNIATCSPVIDAHSVVPNNSDVFEVYRADIRGDVGPDLADSATATVTANGITTTNTFISTDPFAITYYVGKGANGKLEQDITLQIANTADPGATLAFLDAIDYSLLASTSRNEVNLSLNQLNLAAAGVITHLDGMSGLLTGGGLAFEGGDEVGTFGALGSYNFGVQGRYNLADGFSLLGGVSIFDFASTNATARGFGGSFAVRYVDPTASDLRIVAEGGVDLNALSAVSFTRTYTYNNGAVQSATATGAGNGSVAALYGKAGVLWTLDDANEVLLSATIKQSALGIATYSEAFDPVTNPFPANLSGTTTMFTTAKTGADWTTELTPELDLTASLGIGATFANGGTTANVMGGGAATGAAQSTVFADYGLNLGYAPMENAAVNAFVHGTTGTGIGTHVQVGAGARLKF